MSLYRKLDWWSITDSLDAMMEYDYNGNEHDSIYWDHYAEQINELSILASDLYDELNDMRYSTRSGMLGLPSRNLTFYEEDECSDNAIAWFNTAACMFEDIDMTMLLNNEENYSWTDGEDERQKRIRMLERLTKKQFLRLNTTVIGFLTRYLELVSAFDVIKSCITELDYHQSLVKGKEETKLPEAAYL